jgi:16S rRNA A1518/A1519 N6-dimethyltransferase RsmA/KsgA/DIM1 with predicted DNA glycosylase/AP lyase activity
VDARGSRAPRTDAFAPGQHLLPRPLAADLVEHALVERDELIVEIGAGRGALTAAR